MRILKSDFSGKEPVLQFEEGNDRDLLPDEILLKVRACVLDLKSEKLYYDMLTPSQKKCPVGHEVSGQVLKVGDNVENLKVGSEVVGIISLLSNSCGCGDRCILNQYDVVPKPEGVRHEIAAACVGAGLAAYTAVHYQGNVTAGDTVLVMDGSSCFGSISIQLALNWGAKVISTYRTQAERQYLESLKPPIAQVIEMGQKNNILVSAVMEETGRIGVDCFIDNGVRLFRSEEDKDLMGERDKSHLPHKHDVISCLGFSGKWITSHPHLQLDPPDSEQMFLRGSSLSFCSPPSWILMKAQHGRYRHILMDLMQKLENGEIKSNEVTPIPLDSAIAFLTQKASSNVEESNSNNVVVVIP